MSDYFILPTNIKQIGSIGEGMRIYMEDYVCTYLSQYAQAGGYDERLALLVGRYLLIDGQPVLFINGAIQGKYIEEKDGLLHFTDKSEAYGESMIAEFFEGLEVVGWMQSQPGYGLFLNNQYASYHFREFPKVNQVMFVMDPLENVNAFYTYNDDRTALAEARGYFIYYEKNTNMHEYMLTNKATESDYTPQSAEYVDLPKIERVESSSGVAVERLHSLAKSPGEGAAEGSPEDMIRKRQEQRVVKRSARENRRTLNLLVSMSAVLFVVCFVLGAGLVQSQGRIESMETQILQLNAAYRNLYTQLANPVFAPAAVATADPMQAAADTAAVATLSIDEATGIDGGDNGLEIAGIPVHPPVNVPLPEPTPAGNQQAPQTALAPQAAVPTAAASIPETYTIQPGDSLSAISMYFYGTDRVEEILALNGIDDADMIIAGRTILLP